MATITLQYDGRNTAFKQLTQLFLTLGGRIVEDTEPKYDPEMVAKVRKGREDFRKGKCVTIKASEIWGGGLVAAHRQEKPSPLRDPRRHRYSARALHARTLWRQITV